MDSYKTRSNNYIASLGLATYDFLPDLTFMKGSARVAAEVAERLIVLCIMVEVSFNRISCGAAKAFFANNGLTHILTEKELLLLATDDSQRKINETWKIECMVVFFWYLGLLNEMPSPQCLFDLSTSPVYPINSLSESVYSFISSKFNTRSLEEMHYFLDLYSRLDYSCDMAAVNSHQISLNSAVVYERRYTLMWLSDSTITNWDDVKCNSIY